MLSDPSFFIFTMGNKEQITLQFIATTSSQYSCNSLFAYANESKDGSGGYVKLAFQKRTDLFSLSSVCFYLSKNGKMSSLSCFCDKRKVDGKWLNADWLGGRFVGLGVPFRKIKNQREQTFSHLLCNIFLAFMLKLSSFLVFSCGDKQTEQTQQPKLNV